MCSYQVKRAISPSLLELGYCFWGKTCNKNPHIHTHTATHSRTRIDVGKYINRVYISINYFNPCCTLLYASTAWAQDFFRVPKFGNPSCDIHAMHHRACFCFCYFMLYAFILARDFPTPPVLLAGINRFHNRL